MQGLSFCRANMRTLFRLRQRSVAQASDLLVPSKQVGNLRSMRVKTKEPRRPARYGISDRNEPPLPGLGHVGFTLRLVHPSKPD